LGGEPRQPTVGTPNFPKRLAWISGCSNETPTPQKGVKTTEAFEKFPVVWWLKRPFSWQLSGRDGWIFFGGRWREGRKKREDIENPGV